MRVRLKCSRGMWKEGRKEREKHAWMLRRDSGKPCGYGRKVR